MNFRGRFFPREVGEPHDVYMTQLYYAIYTGTTKCLRLKNPLTGIDMGDSNTIQFNLWDKLCNCQVIHDADVHLQ